MFSRIHQKLGTAGLIVAVVALVAALSGAAIAAGGGLTGKQKKEVKKIAKQYAGKNGKDGAAGPAGPQGPAGPKGDTGAKGDAGAAGAKGATGPAGAKGATGAAGAAGAAGEAGACSAKNTSCVMPSGSTLRGAWSIGQTGKDQAFPSDSISFGLEYPGATPPTLVYVTEANAEEKEAECPAAWPEAEAEPGFLCVYEGPSTEPGKFKVQPFFTGFNVTKYGATVVLESESQEVEEEVLFTKFLVMGTWAVTAP